VEKTNQTAYEVYRHEQKYYIAKREALQLREYLKRYMRPDENAGDNLEYWVRSLYFDSTGNHDFYEKINGCSERKKIRLRIYNTSERMAKLEIKIKSGSYMRKESLFLHEEDVFALMKGDLSVLLSYHNPVAVKCYTYMHYEKYRPVVLIDYEREAYFLPVENIRITIDKNARASSDTQRFFKTGIPMMPLCCEAKHILEVKYKTMLPGFLRSFISGTNSEMAPISKYCLGRLAIQM